MLTYPPSVISVPLCYVYPPMLHYKARAKTQQAKAADILLFLFGVAAAIYTTVQTIRVSEGAIFVCSREFEY